MNFRKYVDIFIGLWYNNIKEKQGGIPMSTNATVSIVNENGTVESIYNHWDGYPQNLGFILDRYYKSENRVRDLIGMGDASIIGRKINPRDPDNHDFNKHEKNVCLFYGRDRGEETEEHRFGSVLEMLHEFGQQYNYIYKDKKWWCCTDYTTNNARLMTIDEAIEEEGE